MGMKSGDLLLIPVMDSNSGCKSDLNLPPSKPLSYDFVNKLNTRTTDGLLNLQTVVVIKEFAELRFLARKRKMCPN